MADTATSIDTKAELHKRNLYEVAAMVTAKDFEGPDFNVDLPREAAALETLAYGRAEELLVKAADNFQKISFCLARSKSALAYFSRAAEVRKKTIVGDPGLRESAKNDAERDRAAYTDKVYLDFLQVIRTAEVVIGYLEPVLRSCDEMLQVVKKVRDAAWSRESARTRS